MARKNTNTVNTPKANTTTTAAKETAKKVEEKVAEVKKDIEKTVDAASEKTAEVEKNIEKTVQAVKEDIVKEAETVKEKTEAVKKTVKKKVDAVKTETKKRTTRKPVKKIVLQYLGKEFDEAELTDRAIAQFHSVEGAIDVKTITMYLKPEEDAAYYVINDQYTGRVEF